MKHKEKILITGGLGFIGHHLTKYLTEFHPHLKLVIVDNLSSTIINYDWLKSKAEIYIMDFLDFQSDEKFASIYHLASPVGSIGILSRNGYIAREIIQLTYKVAELAIRIRAKLLFVSSSEVYGHEGVHNEESHKIVPAKKGTRIEYGLGKLLSEEILYNLALENNLIYNICRPFNVFGEFQSGNLGFVIPTFFEHAFLNNPLPVFQDGSQQRSFCHVRDIVEALVAIMVRGKNKEVYNIGHDKNCISILKLAERIIEITNSRSAIKYTDPNSIYGEKYCEAFDKIPDLQKIKDHINWVPKIKLNTALNRLSNFYSNEEEFSVEI